MQIDDGVLLLVPDYDYSPGAPRGALVVEIFTMSNRRYLTSASARDTDSDAELGAAVNQALLALFSKCGFPTPAGNPRIVIKGVQQ